MEIVGEPDLRSPEEARDYSWRCARFCAMRASRPRTWKRAHFGATPTSRCEGLASLSGPRSKSKNMNSFRAVERALQFEGRRQLELLRVGERIEQETRGWVEDRGITVSQRTKEQAHDYRYFPEPDLHRCSSLRRWWTGCGRACQSFPPRGGSDSCKSSR